jgi:predicted transcriptional regulator
MGSLFIDALKRHVSQYDTQQDAAKSLGIAPSYLSDLLKGKRGASDRLLKAMGLTRTITRVTTKARTA